MTPPRRSGSFSRRRPLHVIIGPAEHGVVLHALRLAETLDADVLRARRVPTSAPEADVTIIHFTDRVFGRDALSAASSFSSLVRKARRVVTVLHDIPQTSDGDNLKRRREGYQQVMDASDRIVVSSHHERRLLEAFSPRAEACVIPLPIDRWHFGVAPLESPRAESSRPTATTLGFIYPGKGLEELIDALGQRWNSPIRPTCVNLGAVSPGHEYLAGQLTMRGSRQDVQWNHTGWLPVEKLRPLLHASTVPVAPHRHVSASASINTWLEAGRRPLVSVSAYTRELNDRLPGALSLVADGRDQLAAALDDAIAHPSTTWLGADVKTGPTSLQAAKALEAL